LTQKIQKNGNMAIKYSFFIFIFLQLDEFFSKKKKKNTNLHVQIFKKNDNQLGWLWEKEKIGQH